MMCAYPIKQGTPTAEDLCLNFDSSVCSLELLLWLQLTLHKVAGIRTITLNKTDQLSELLTRGQPQSADCHTCFVPVESPETSVLVPQTGDSRIAQNRCTWNGQNFR